MANDRILLLAGDKAWAHEDELQGVGDPVLTHHHRVFSIMVNFHAIGGWCEAQGGFALHAPNREVRLRVSAFGLGVRASSLPETTCAFRENLASFGVYEYFTLATAMRQKDAFEPTLPLLLGLLRLSDGDYNVILSNATLLTKLAKAADPGSRRDLLAALERAWESFYPMDRDFPFELGRIYSALERPMDALRCYQTSLRLFGDHEATFMNAGLALYRLQQRKEALAMMERALAIKPSYASARDWRNRIQSELAEGR
jgi:tetratricopeptide (TPR) repeat protein